MKMKCQVCKFEGKALLVNDEPTCPRCGADAFKRGARNSAADIKRIQGAHDLLSEAGAACNAPMGKSLALNVIRNGVKALTKKGFKCDENYAVQESWDVMNAASALSSLGNLAQSEAAQMEPDDVSELCAIMRALLSFVVGEIDELEQAAQTDEGADGAYIPSIAGRTVSAKTDKVAPPTAKENPFNFAYVKSLHLPHDEQYFRDVLAVKSVGKDGVEGYLALWGSRDNPDLESDFFTKSTNFWDNKIAFPRPLTWEHGLDPKFKGDVGIGLIEEFEDDELGRIYRATLDRNTRYRKLVDGVIRERAVGTSSDSAPQYVQRVPVGKGAANWLKQWPLWAASLTATPCEPRMFDTVHFKSIGVQVSDPVAADVTPDVLRLPEDVRHEAQLLISRFGA